MKNCLLNLRIGAVVGLTFLGISAKALTYTYIGEWSPNDPAAPSAKLNEPLGPIAFTAQEAAALLFGGSPSDYAISTFGPDPDFIDNMAWYDVVGVGANVFAEDYSNKHLGKYYGPTSGYGEGDKFWDQNAASALVRDHGVDNKNFAFRIKRRAPDSTNSHCLLVALAGAGIVASRNPRKGL